MHDCQNTKEELLDLLFGEASETAARRETEIALCDVCENEYVGMKQTFAEYEKFAELDVPEESYWQNYEAALSQKLLSAETMTPPRRKSFFAELFGNFPAWQIRVPIPVAAAFVVLFAVAAFFAGRFLTERVQTVENSAEPQIQIVPVEREKIVVQEKEIWRDRVAIQKVYVPRRENKVKNGSGVEVSAREKHQTETPEKTAPTLNLAEFQPPPKVEPKIVAEGKFDEK